MIDLMVDILAQTLNSGTSPALSQLKEKLLSPSGIVLLACVGGFILLQILNGSNSKHNLASGRWGGAKEKGQARKRARKQISNRLKNAVTLYLNWPTVKVIRKNDKRHYKFSREVKTTYVPDAQRGIAVVGAPGTGKTFGVIDPLIRSIIHQGFPLCLYDFKYPTQTARIAALAARYGYEVRVFAPGFPETDVCNPLDLMSSPQDAMMARQMATVLNRNFKLQSQATDDPFFSNAGDQLVEATLMLAKASRYPDIMMAFSILGAEELIARLRAGRIDPWIEVAFKQLYSTAGSEKTVASIISTAALTFTRFMKAGILGAFCGQTTLALDLQGKQLLIFGMDRERRDVVGPLLATILHLIITRNVVHQRQDPIVVALDELPTIYLPNLTQWLNENREDGLVTLLGFQNLLQLEKAYGKELAGAIFGGCATKFLFNPQNQDSAENFSRYLGDEEVHFTTKSKNIGSGKTSTTKAEQERTRRLFSSDQFLKLPMGRCIFLNPAYGTTTEAGVPLNLKLKVAKQELQLQSDSQSLWQHLQQQLAARGIVQLPTQADVLHGKLNLIRPFPFPRSQRIRQIP